MNVAAGALALPEDAESGDDLADQLVLAPQVIAAAGASHSSPRSTWSATPAFPPCGGEFRPVRRPSSGVRTIRNEAAPSGDPDPAAALHTLIGDGPRYTARTGST